MPAFSVPSFVVYNSFDTQVGETYWIPGTFCAVTLFPTRILVLDVSGEKELVLYDLHYDLGIKFFDLFQVECQWDRGRILVIVREGHYSCTFSWEWNPKDPRGCIARFLRGKFLIFRHYKGAAIATLQKGESLLMDSEKIEKLSDAPIALDLVPIPKIAFGVHKQKCLHKMNQRKNPAELLPCFYAMSVRLPEKISPEASITATNSYDLLDASFQHLLLRHFYSSGMPSWSDRNHYGLKELYTGNGSPLTILKSLGKLILNAFVLQNDSKIIFLGNLPSWSSCGRFRKIPFEFGYVCVCWSSGRLRISVLEVKKDFFCYLVFPKGVRSVRITTKDHGPGVCHLVGKAPMPMVLHAGNTYCLDRIEY